MIKAGWVTGFHQGLSLLLPPLWLQTAEYRGNDLPKSYRKFSLQVMNVLTVQRFDLKETAYCHIMSECILQTAEETLWGVTATVSAHARARFSAYASVPVHSHPVINISAISIIYRWISPLRCTKIIQTFLCWNWSINISTGCLFVERLKGWKARCALLSFASFALCCGNEKHTSLSCLPAPNIFFPLLLCIHFDTLDALSLSVLSLWHIYPPFFATSALPFPFLSEFLASI